jgi:hypothetical protein
MCQNKKCKPQRAPKGHWYYFVSSVDSHSLPCHFFTVDMRDTRHAHDNNRFKEGNYFLKKQDANKMTIKLNKMIKVTFNQIKETQNALDATAL